MHIISILNVLILKLENERELYQATINNTREKVTEVKNKYDIGLKIDSFLENLSKIDDVELQKQKIDEFRKKKTNSRKTYGDYFDLDLDSLPKIRYSLLVSKDLEYYSPQNASLKLFQIAEAYKSVGEKAVVSSIQYFEEFFSLLLRGLILSKPEAYFHNKKIDYKDLVSIDIDTIKERMLNEEVDAQMYAVSKTIEAINQTHGLHLEKYKDIWDKYIEIDCHRNIIIHNNGKVNIKYNNDVPEMYKKEENNYIPCNSALVNEDINALIKFAYLLCYLIWKDENQLDELQDVAFNFLKKEEWELGEFSYGLLRKIPKQDYIFYKNCEINQLNAIKHIKGLDQTKAEIEQLDVSGMENLFQLAKLLLLEDNQAILDAIELSYSKELSVYTIIDWPIFIEFRKTEEFTKFIKKHSSDFEKIDYVTNPQIDDSGESNI